MDTVKYFREKVRMTKGCGIECGNCPHSMRNNGLGVNCIDIERYHPDKAVEIVERWSKEHPVKTYKMDFFEKFPKAPRSDDGVPTVCIDDLYGEGVGIEDCECKFDGCAECWNRPMLEVVK